MYKITNNVTATLVSELFSFSNINYNLRSGSQFHQPSANTVWNGLETISYLGPKIWNMLLAEMKQKSSLFFFKGEIKNGSQNTAHIEYVKSAYQCRVHLTALIFLKILFYFFNCAYNV